MIVIAVVLRQYMWLENRRRDRKYGKPDAQTDATAVASGFQDLTDTEVRPLALQVPRNKMRVIDRLD